MIRPAGGTITGWSRGLRVRRRWVSRYRAGCPGTALGLDAVESALGSFFAGLKVALQGAAVFVAGEVHQVGFGGAVLAGVGEAGVAQVVQVPAASGGAEVTLGGAVGHPPPAAGRVDVAGGRGAVVRGDAGGQEDRPRGAAAEELAEHPGGADVVEQLVGLAAFADRAGAAVGAVKVAHV